MGIENSEEEVDIMLCVLGEIAKNLKKKGGEGSTPSGDKRMQVQKREAQRKIHEFVDATTLKVYSISTKAAQ